METPNEMYENWLKAQAKALNKIYEILQMPRPKEEEEEEEEEENERRRS